MAHKGQLSYEDAKTYLENWDNDHIQMSWCVQRLRELREIADGTPTISYEDHGHSSFKKELRDKVNDLADFELKYKEKLESLEKRADKITYILDLMSKVYPRYSAIITMRYLQHKTLGDIAEELHISSSYIFVELKKAITEFGKCWN